MPKSRTESSEAIHVCPPQTAPPSNESGRPVPDGRDNLPVIARRSCLSVPATQPRFFEKADQSAADFVFFDLEDSVPPSAKERGRELAVEALRGHEYRGKSRGVRVHACDTQWCFDDLRAVGE